MVGTRLNGMAARVATEWAVAAAVMIATEAATVRLLEELQDVAAMEVEMAQAAPRAL